MKHQFLSTVLFVLLFSVSALAQENKAIQITTKDASNNVQKKVFVIPQDEDVVQHLEQSDLPTAVQNKIKLELQQNYTNGEDFQFVENDNGTEYSFEISADANSLPKRKDRVHRIQRMQNRNSAPNWNGKDNVFLLDGRNAAYLGVAVEAFDHKETNSSLRGVVVKEVVEGEAAYNAGIEVGDVITAINDLKTPSPSLFKDAVSELEPREEVTFQFVRNGNAQSVRALAGKKSGFDFWNGKGDRPLPARNFEFDIEEFTGNKAQLGVLIKEHEDGVEVTSVIEESAAEKAGVEIGDVITSVDGAAVKTPDDLVKLIREKGIGDKVTIHLERGNKKKKVNATLEESDAPLLNFPRRIEFKELMNESNLGDQLKTIELELSNLLPTIEQQLEELQPQIEQQLKQIQPVLEKQLQLVETQMNTI